MRIERRCANFDFQMARALSLAELDAYDPHEGQRRLCPLCGDSKPRDSAHRSLSFDARSGLWKCFRCGEGGLLKEFWTEKPSTFQNARQASRTRLRQTFGLPEVEAAPVNETLLPPVQPTEVEPPVVEAPPDSLSWEERWQQTKPLAGSAGEHYLIRRGIVTPVAEAAGVCFAPSWFGHASVVFPVRDLAGELVAAQGRAVRGSAKLTAGPKRNGVFFAPAPKSTTLPVDGAPLAVFEPLDAVLPAVIIAEAPIDALSLATCGFPAMALCGTSGPSWLHIACGLRRVLLAFDADEAGDRAAQEIQARLQFGSRCERLVPEGAKDWNEMLLVYGRDFLGDWLTERVLFANEG